MPSGKEAAADAAAVLCAISGQLDATRVPWDIEPLTSVSRPVLSHLSQDSCARIDASVDPTEAGNTPRRHINRDPALDRAPYMESLTRRSRPGHFLVGFSGAMLIELLGG
jgi:hypothetical protein